MSFFRRSLLVSLTALLVAGGAVAGRASEVAVIELFTSQGCSSCPKADALLTTYAARDGIIALSYNVDYWDYLGWKDTLASPAHTQRWRDYAKARGDGQVYTPRAIVNGLGHAIGSKAKRIDAAIAETAPTLAGRRPSLTITRDAATFEISIGANAVKPGKPATVWVASVRERVTVPIKRGENVGSTITYVNVVRALQAVGTWTGEPALIKVPESAVRADASDRYAVLVQESSTGPMLAAAWAP